METTVRAGKRRERRRRVSPTPYLFLLPALVLFLVFRVYPLVNGFWLSFTSARLGRTQYAFVGLSNYEKLLHDDRFLVSLVNTAYYTAASTLPILALPLLLAVVLNREVALKALLRGAFFFPFTLSVVTVGLTWLWLLDPIVGPFIYYLKRIGLPVGSLLAEPRSAMWGIVLTSVWWVTGYYLVIYLAGLQDIPRHLYEAAAIDGATAWRSFWSITLPLLRPVFLFVFVIHIIGSFQIFGQVYVMTQGGPAHATDLLITYTYTVAFKLSKLDYAAALTVANFLFFLFLALLANKLSGGEAGAVDLGK